MARLCSAYGCTLASKTRMLQLLFLLFSPLLAFGGAGRSIEETEAWRAATFFLFFFCLSILVEQFFHHLEHYLSHVGESGILMAVHKIKEELMLLGFISLMLIIFEENVIRMCVPVSPFAIGIPCCNTQPADALQAIIRADLEACLSDAGASSLAIKKCNKEATAVWANGTNDEWEALGNIPTQGFVPLPTSALIDSCAAPGQDVNAKLISDKHDFECLPTEDGQETASFIDVNALHQLHTLIFLTAIFHILYSTLIMFISQYRVKNWTRWETYGDDDDETVDKLRTPPKLPNCCFSLFVNFFQQFYKTVDPMTYIAVRRYYITRNNLPITFNFNEQLMEVHRSDFRELVGVSSWMWFLVIVLLLIDGYIPSSVRAGKMLNTYVALFAVLVVGVKLMFVFRSVVHGVLDKLGIDHSSSFKGGHVTAEDLDKLQDQPIEDKNIFDDVEANFWCAKCFKKKCLGDAAPKVLLNLIRLTMFQNSFTIAQLTFFAGFVGESVGGFDETCFHKSRAIWIYVIQIVVVIAMILMNGLVTVPLYSIVAITTHHKVKRGKLHEQYKTVKHVLKDELQIIKNSLHHDRAEENEATDHTDHGTEEAVRHDDLAKSASISDISPLKKTGDETDKKRSKQRSASLSAGNAFMFHARETMLKLRLDRTKRELAAMHTLKSHLKPEDSEENTENTEKTVKPVKNSKVAPTPSPSKKRSSRKLLPSGSSVSIVASKALSISKLPVVRMIITLVLLSTLVGVLLVSPGSWWPGYGYYVPHWTYEGWGGPQYWKKLTNNNDKHMDNYNAENPQEWTVSKYDSNAVWTDGEAWNPFNMQTGQCKKGAECVSYRECEDGTKQSPININIGQWQWPKFDNGEYSKGQHQNYKKGKKMADCFSPKASKYAPLLYHGLLKFFCPSSGGCGYFKNPVDGHKYKVYNMLLHTPSEHTFDNQQNGMELQIYLKEKVDDHRRQLGGGSSAAKLAVISVLFDVVGQSNSTLVGESAKELNKLFGKSEIDKTTAHPVYANFPSEVRIPGFISESKQLLAYKYVKDADYTKMAQTAEKVDLSKLVNMNSGFFHYKGSHTTPPCAEGIDHEGMDWFIQADVVHMTELQFLGIHDYIGYPGNARPTQDFTINKGRNLTYYGIVNPSANSVNKLANNNFG